MCALQAVMTWDEAKAYADSHPEVMGFTWAHRDRYPKEPTRFWFKRVMEVLYNEDWWSYSTGRGM